MQQPLREPALLPRGLPLRPAAVALALSLALPRVAAAQTAPSAEDHFTVGSQLFAARSYAAAAREFELAYEAEHRAELLFNLARAREEGGMLAAALDAYRRFDRAMPLDFDRASLRVRVADLERRIALTTPPPTTPRAAASPTPALAARPAPRPLAPRPRSGPPGGAVALMVTGGAVVLTGAVLGALASAAYDGCRVEGDVARCPSQAVLDRARDAPTFAATANTAFVVGALAVAAGVTWWVLAPDRRVTVGAGPTSVSLALRW